MKVIHVLPSFFPDTVGGTEMYCFNLCKHLQQAGVDVEVVIPNYSSSEFLSYDFDGIKVTKYPEPTISTRFHILGFKRPIGIINFINYVRKTSPDFVHFHSINNGTGITLEHLRLVSEARIASIYTMHVATHVCYTQTMFYNYKQLCDGVLAPLRCSTCIMVHKKKPHFVAFTIALVSKFLHYIRIDSGKWNHALGTGFSLYTRVLQMKSDLDKIIMYCDNIIVLTNWFKEVLINNGVPQEKIHLIPQTIPDLVDASEAENDLFFNSKDSIKLIFIGRISKLKGIDTLIRSVASFNENNIELSIYGQKECNEFVSYCEHLSEGKKNIHWRGTLSREKIKATLQQHHVLCLPSITEMSPLVIQEAFSVGLPVLASNIHANREQIKHEVNGLLFEVNSSISLSLEIQKIIKNKSILSRLKANILPPTGFNQKVKAYLSIYKTL